MKKVALALSALVVVLLLTGIFWLGPSYIIAAPKVATGMGAKLACSSKYVSGLTEQQAKVDLTSYSPLLAELNVDFDDQTQSVTTSFYGFQARASFHPGLGCAIDFTGVNARDSVVVPELAPAAGAWPLGSEVNTIEPDLQAVLDQMLIDDNAVGLESRALLLVQGDHIVAESYAPGIGPASQLLGWSMGKSVTAIAIGRLIYEERLGLEETDLFSEWRNDQRKKISVQHLLTMTDGLDFDEIYAPGKDVTSMLFTEPNSASFALQSPALYQPGSHFNYSSGSANILSALVQQRSGATLQTNVSFLDEHLYRPLGLTHALFESDAGGTLVGSSYFYASARDWARIGLLMLNRGEINGQRLLSKEFVDMASSPNGSENEKAYGFQFWLNAGDASLRWPNVPEDAYAAMGNRSQIVMIMPSDNLVFVRLGWTNGDYPTDANIAKVVAAARKH
ncbi:serine hydrolase [Simiduia curdlanivorans]|uniref:Serine hydrolase domain-containing protein n=1 Tax=Simiduia curdlanivorans TaxID=1492769 RepID=A0ABV8V3M7_9GAMM|nr:serine hydrolase [Simiduia curdlanivorans]MDN3640067.1 serine hydrolase [Simiduia curdlanivorans]